jgi:hypothetical protein
MEAKVALPQAYCFSVPHDTAVKTHCFNMSAFSTSCFVLSAIDIKIKHRVCIKFWVKLGRFAAKTLKMLCEAFAECSLNQTVVFEWNSHFKAGRVSVEGDKCSGPPSNIKMTENVEKKTRQTIHELTDIVDISYGVFQEILTENVNMRFFAVKSASLPGCFIPKERVPDNHWIEG